MARIARTGRGNTFTIDPGGYWPLVPERFRSGQWLFVSKGIAILLAVTVCTVAPVAAEAKTDSPKIRPEVSTTLVVNEVLTTGAAGQQDEFLEVRNISTTNQDLTGVSLRFHGPDCRLREVLQLVPGGDVILPPDERAIVIGPDFSGSTTALYVLSAVSVNPDGFMAEPAGMVALFKGQTRIDAVGWRSPSLPPGVPCPAEGRPALPPPPFTALSITRDVLGTDTDDNRTDFHLDVPTP